MCGIFIVINKNLEPINVQKSIDSLNLMKGRGPDWSFYKLFEKNIFFGQVVLSMTGKLEKKTDNFYSISNRYFIVFNGEIYNYKNIYKNYFKKKFNKNITDTSVLLNLFDIIEIEKINTLLDGMYAYVVFDKKNKNLIISSDPQGEKRLYIYEDNKKIILSSEVNSILRYTNDKVIDPEILKNYFYTRHFINFNNTLFKKIKILEPGLLQTICLKKFIFKNLQTITLHSYVNENQYNKNNNRNEYEIKDELDFLIKKNLKDMIPYGRNFSSITSGGIDSSLISSYLNDIKKPNYLIFLNHIGKDKISDYISNFEKYLGKITIKIVDKKLYHKFLIESIRICASPIFSHDFVGKLILSKTVQELNCKAVFGGDGADELFGGYSTYLQKNINFEENKSDYSKLLKNSIFYKNNNFFIFKNQLNSRWKNCLKSYSFVKNKSEKNKLAMMLMDSSVQLPSVALRGSDLMTTYNSVETRSLFLRKEIIQFALNLPLKFKISKNTKSLSTKIILKKLFIKNFSEQLIYPKQGFSGFPNEMGKVLGNHKKYLIKDFLKIQNFNKVIKSSNRATLWKIYNTEFFLREFLN
jgi:asparagine synthase (glutamine-hydrolysing)